jgi:aryl-alcohol dehydrogenase-like predicted oxidoreductase
MSNRIALGTVQFGLAYGIANARGQVGRHEAAEILAIARQGGVDTLDTAAAYGESETVLGGIGARGWRIVTKLPGLPENVGDASAWLEEALTASLARLRIDRLAGLMLHRPGDLLRPEGPRLYQAMQAARERGVVGKIGYSVYGPQELDQLVARFTPDIVQAPLNVFDRRLLESGWLARLRQAGVEVHVRSAFLQGLLLMDSAARPPKFARWSAHFSRWDAWLADHRAPPVAAALNFALQQPVDRVVVGVAAPAELREILTHASDAPLPFPETLGIEDEDLINPAKWNRL